MKNLTGFIYSHKSVFNCLYSDFINNSANGYGGVLYDADSSLINIMGCDFFNNSASYGGVIGGYKNSSININGVFYNRTTNESGYAKLNINLEPDNFTITSMYMDCSESNTIRILNVLYAEDLYMHYMDGSQFVVMLVDGQGRAYPGQQVTFNINGVFYQRITNDNGEARLNIRLQAGTYTITSEYNGAKISNTITVAA